MVATQVRGRGMEGIVDTIFEIGNQAENSNQLPADPDLLLEYEHSQYRVELG